MELARLASQQQASKLASSAGPFLVRRAEGVPKSRKKVTTLSGMVLVFRNCLGTTFFRSETNRSETVIWWVFDPFWAAGTERNSRPGLKMGRKWKSAISRCYGSRNGKKVTTLSRMVVRNFLTCYVLTDRTPTGGKSQNKRILGHFGLGWPLALREIPGLGRHRKITISRR